MRWQGGKVPTCLDGDVERTVVAVVTLRGGEGNHQGVVAAEGERREVHAPPLFFGFLLQCLAQQAVGADTTGDD